MKITWLGQAGLMLEKDGITILVDPYLSDSVSKINPQNKRRIDVNEKFLHITPDVIICTHNHLDHTDPDTLCHYLKADTSVLVLAPQAAWQEIRKFGGPHNYIRFNRHTELTYSGICFKAVRAEHTDEHPIGVIIEDGEKRYYITGDTLYNTEIFEDIPSEIDVLFVPVNGVGNNMNMADAARFCEKIKPKKVVPLHFGLFDDIDMNKFSPKNKVIPKIYEQIML